MRTLPVIYSQRDPRWSGQRLGTVDGTTIGSDGCYVTSFAMLGKYFGHDINPAQLDDIFTNRGWYVKGNLMTDDNLQKAFPDCVYQQTFHYESVPADLSKLKDLMTDPTVMVVLEVDFNPEKGGLQTHFVVCVDCDGTNVQIADPWTGTVHDIKTPYGAPKTTIQKFVVYKGKAPATTQPDTEDSLRKQRDDNWNLYQGELQKNKDLSTTNSSLQSQVDSLNSKINKAKTDLG